MSLPIKYYPRAKRDLEAIYEYTLDRWGASQAERYTYDLEEQLKSFAELPWNRRSSDEFTLLYGKHRIFLRVTDDAILVRRIMHQAQAYKILGITD